MLVIFCEHYNYLFLLIHNENFNYTFPGRAARELISSNGRDIVLEIGPPVIKALFDEIVNSVQNFLNHVPAEDLTLDV